MALVDPNIAMSFRAPEIKPRNTLAEYAQLQQLMTGQQTQELNRLQMQEYERAREEEQNIRNRLAGGASLDDAGTRNFLLGSKTGRDILQRQSDLLKAQTEDAARRAKLMQDTEAMYRNMATQIGNKADAANFLQRMLNDPALKDAPITRIPLMEQVRHIPDDPQGLDNWIKRFALGATKWVTENKPTTQVIDQGGQRQVIQTPGLGGAPTTIGTYADVPLPAAVEEQQRRLKQAGAGTSFTNVQTFTPASETAQAEYMKGVRATYDTLKNAPATLKNIDAAKALIPKAAGFMGPGGEPLLKAASFLSNRFGVAVDVKGITDATELRSRLFSGVIENLRKLDAQPTQLQQQALQEAIGNLGTDPNALPRVLDAMADSIRDKVELYNQDVTSAEQRGVKFPYKPQITLPSPSTGGAATAAPAAANIPIPQAAIDDLKAGRGTDAQFDATFGAGAAKRVRGQK